MTYQAQQLEGARFPVTIIADERGAVAPPEIVNLAVELLNALHTAGSLVMSSASRFPGLVQVGKLRLKQLAKGYDATHDDQHAEGVLTRGALAFIASAFPSDGSLSSNLPMIGAPEDYWPWDETFTPSGHTPGLGGKRGRYDDLVKAAALLVAEVERLERVEGRGDTEARAGLVSAADFDKMGAELQACYRVISDPIDAAERTRATQRALVLEAAIDAAPWEYDEATKAVVAKKAK